MKSGNFVIFAYLKAHQPHLHGDMFILRLLKLFCWYFLNQYCNFNKDFFSIKGYIGLGNNLGNLDVSYPSQIYSCGVTQSRFCIVIYKIIKEPKKKFDFEKLI